MGALRGDAEEDLFEVAGETIRPMHEVNSELRENAPFVTEDCLALR
jgi:hypothetical protein